jgi:membrane dipeptidase
VEIDLDRAEQASVDRLHHESLVVDVHSDVHLEVIRARGRGEKRVLEGKFYSRWKQAGVDVVVLNTISKFGPDPYPYRASPVHNVLLTVDAISQETSESPNCFDLVLEPEDILRAQDAGKIGLMLGTEGAEAVESSLGFLRCFYRLGLRVMNLTWHQRNLVADGVAEPSNAGLSNFGREVVREMNRLGIVIDVSHLSTAGVQDVLELSSQPVIASHSNARAVYDHPRNLLDWQIEGIAHRGGLVGVTFLGRFVGAENPTLRDVLDHVDHIAALVGAEHIAMGPDYVESGAKMIIQARRVAGPDQPVDDDGIPFAQGVEEVTRLPGFTHGLVSRGYSDEQIRGILGGNFLRLFQQVRQTRQISS